jgi:hypothetical protein
MFFRLLPLLALIPAVVNAYFVFSPWFGLGALLVYLSATGLAIGSRFLPGQNRLAQLGLGAMVSIAVLSIFGSAVYYSANVTTESLLAVLLLVAVIASAGYAPAPQSTPNQIKLAYAPIDLALFGLGLMALVGWWIAAGSIDIVAPVRSPWLALDPFTLVALGLGASCCLALLMRAQARQLGLVLLMALLLSATSLAANLYSLGYGFDPFLHRATVDHIATHGTITPKPLYYIGQYALELIGLKIFALPLFTLDVLLAPILASLGIAGALGTRQKLTHSPGLMLACLLFLPLGAFVQTTPQALAFVFTAWCLFAPPRPWVIPAVFALAAIITHPLAGIGAAMYVLLLALAALPDHLKKWRVAGTIGLSALSAIAIPVAFVLQAALADLPLRFNPIGLLQLHKLPLDTFFATYFNSWGDIAYLFIGNAFALVIILAIAGLRLTPKTQHGWYIPALVAASMFVNFMIVSLGFDFAFLIAYERLDFALRLLTLTTIFLLPYVAVLFGQASKKLLTAPAGLRLGFVGMLAIIFMSNVYGAYPRHDNYARSSGFNVGPADIDSVRAIEDRANTQDYLVLSDQALAAAAVQELGFKTYYQDDIFFYPIPTGGPLYQHFLTMVEDTPSRETVLAAMDLARVDLAYFAVHDYWWQAPAIIENTKALADDWFAIGEGAVTIFEFRR